jgi:hypothetical protein
METAARLVRQLREQPKLESRGCGLLSAAKTLHSLFRLEDYLQRKLNMRGSYACAMGSKSA